MSSIGVNPVDCATCLKVRGKAYCVDLRPERPAYVCFDCCRAITGRMVTVLKVTMGRNSNG